MVQRLQTLTVSLHPSVLAGLEGRVDGTFNTFFDTTEFNVRFSSSFIALISKVSCPTSINDFRPISFLGLVHKLVASVLTERLKGVMEKLVRDSKSTFIWGKNIIEGRTVALEVVDVMRCSGKRVIFNIDFKKAYDCID